MGSPPLCDTVSVRAEERSLCSQVSSACVTVPEGLRGGARGERGVVVVVCEFDGGGPC